MRPVTRMTGAGIPFSARWLLYGTLLLFLGFSLWRQVRRRRALATTAEARPEGLGHLIAAAREPNLSPPERAERWVSAATACLERRGPGRLAARLAWRALREEPGNALALEAYIRGMRRARRLRALEKRLWSLAAKQTSDEGVYATLRALAAVYDEDLGLAERASVIERVVSSRT